MKLDVKGNKIWDKTIGDTGDNEPTSLQQTPNGGYILGGWSDSALGGDKNQASKGSFDYWVIKLGPNFADLNATLTTSCGSSSSNVNVNIAELQFTTTGTPSWILNYTVNGINQTATGARTDFTLQQNAVP